MKNYLIFRIFSIKNLNKIILPKISAIKSLLSIFSLNHSINLSIIFLHFYNRLYHDILQDINVQIIAVVINKMIF